MRDLGIKIKYMVRVKKTDNSKSVFEGSIDVDSFLLVVEELPSGRIFDFVARVRLVIRLHLFD